MLEDLYYRRQGVIDVDAAVVGISRLRWTALDPSYATEERARTIMEEHRFDVLPIAADGGSVSGVFRTKQWGDYSAVERAEIGYEDVLPQQTPIRSVIRGFAEENRLYYFLTHEHQITGLISVVNLNCRQARTFLFGLLSELEVRLGRLVQAEVEAGRLDMGNLLGKDDVRERYEQDRSKGVERDVVEYLYLSDLCSAVKVAGLHEAVGFESRGRAKKTLGSLSDLRNKVAHPSKAMVKEVADARRLWQRVVAAERAIFHLRRWESAYETEPL